MRNLHLDRLLKDVKEVKQASEALFSSLTPEQITWKPNKKSWSVLECYDHLLVTNGQYIPRIEGALKKAEQSVEKSVRPFKPSYFGRLFIKSLKPQSRLKIKTFRIFKPKNGPQNLNIPAQFLAQQDELIELIKRADQCDVNSVKFSSPVSRLIRFSLGEGLSVIVVHEQRHLLQAQNLQLFPEFPEFQQVKRI
ncbi:MAG: DinB family protein [Rhodothermaceae bacterium]|nr:DinB family protein [Rhodothermaceae bacterium]